MTLGKEEREELDAISSKGKQKAKNVLYALIPLAVLGTQDSKHSGQDAEERPAKRQVTDLRTSPGRD